MKNRVLKYLAFGALALLMAVLVASTILGAFKGNGYTQETIYSSPLFVALWGVMVLSALLYIFSTSTRHRFPTLLLHLAFALILTGALITYTTAERGALTLCKDSAPASMFTKSDGTLAKFPFRITLQECGARYRDGEDVPCDYFADINVALPDGSETASLAMNKVYDKDGFRFYISDIAGNCATLLVSHDPWGVPVTYSGYLLAVFSFMLILTARNTQRAVLVQGLAKLRISGHKFPQGGWYKILIADIFLLGYITFQGIYRWRETGVFPVSNGPGVLMFIAWCSTIATIFFRKNRNMALGTLSFGIICVAIALLSGENTQDSVQPVLRSPLLPLHVITIVASYVIIGLMAVNSLVALCLYMLRRDYERLENTALFGRVMLYFATLLLITGIFIGAVWANISWGRYWGWDPKEVWALITLIICSFGFHTSSFPFMNRALVFHCFCLLAFLSMLFTFFGVNYLLGGLHSYA